jgi:Calx-beta domain
MFTAHVSFAQGTPTMSISDATANEADVGVSNSVTFTITLSALPQQAVSFTATTQSGTAVGDVDFAAGSITVAFEPDKTTQTVTVFTKGDTLVEGSEQFFLNLSNPVNATIADGQGVGTIVDDDALILLTEANVQRAVALDSVLFVRDSLPVANTLNFSSDHLTRVSLFAIGVKLSQGENASAITATAEDSQGTIRPLECEFVGRVPTYDWLYQVVLKLNSQITTTGDIKIKITLHGETSNTVLVGVRPQ